MRIMKTVFTGVCVLASFGAHAGGWYLGASTGIMNTDVSGFDNAVNAGLLAGYDFFTTEMVAVSIEAEATTTISDGDLKVFDETGDWDIDSQAALLAVRVGDTVYMKVRTGVTRSDISGSIDSSNANKTDTSIAWGGALGWRVNERWAVQADSIVVDSDITYWNLGLLYHFE